MLLAGRAAEAHAFADDFSSGASDDLRRAAALATTMVKDLGMSRRGAAAAVGDSDETVRDELTRAETRARDLVRDHDGVLRAAAEALMAHETLDAAGLEAVFGAVARRAASSAAATAAPSSRLATA